MIHMGEGGNVATDSQSMLQDRKGFFSASRMGSALGEIQCHQTDMNILPGAYKIERQ